MAKGWFKDAISGIGEMAKANKGAWLGVAISALKFLDGLSSDYRAKKAKRKQAIAYLDNYQGVKEGFMETVTDLGTKEFEHQFGTSKASSLLEEDIQAQQLTQTLNQPSYVKSALTAIDSGAKDIAIAESQKRTDFKTWLQDMSLQEDFKMKQKAFWEETDLARKELEAERLAAEQQKKDNKVSWFEKTFLSDENLKENIKLIGKSPNGINVYEFEYKNKKYGEGRYQGVMAQEVPEASYDNNGKLWVDYSKIDVEFNGSSRNGIVLKTTRSATGTNFMEFLNSSGGNAGEINHNGSTSVNYSTSSDYRLKENVSYNFDATTRLKQLKPARFNFIADGTDRIVDGFLAHEVQLVVPEAITGTHNGVEVWKDGEELPDGISVGDNKLDNDGNTIPKYQSIDQSKLVPLLVKTIQEALAEIDTLKTKVAALESE